MRDPAEPVIDALLAALDPPGALHPGFARHVAERLRELRPRPLVRVGDRDRVALCEPYLRGFPIDGVAISTLGSAFDAETVAASDSTAMRLDEIQLDLGEGPCWDAITADASVFVPDTTIETRWPSFADAVRGIDIRAVFAFPLVFAGLPVGAVDVYSRTSGPLADTLVRDITAASTMTSLRVLAAVLRDAREEESGDPRSRRIVQQATGMLLARYRTTPENALMLLRAHAFAHDRSVMDVSDDIVKHRHAFPDSPLTASED